jgi:hypothetical protein
MSDARSPAQGPTWRQPRPARWELERAFVACRCGVDMEFTWPRSAEAVRCFGCGASFPRPGHLPPVVRFRWAPDAPAPSRAGGARQHLPLLALVLLAGALLGLGVGLLFGR